MSEELLDPEAARALAEKVEDAQLAAGAVRYGRVGQVGCARVVVNADSPLPSSNFAVGLDSTSATVGHTLLALESTFADVGRAEALVHASPTTVPEIEGLADDAGWFAVTEGVAVVRLVPSDPVAGVRRARGDDLPAVAELIADAVELPDDGLPELTKLLGHRLDDPRTVLVVDADVSGVALGYAGEVGVVEQLTVRAARRRRGIGSALLAALEVGLFDAGASLVAGVVDETGASYELALACGYAEAYPVTTYARRVTPRSEV